MEARSPEAIEADCRAHDCCVEECVAARANEASGADVIESSCRDMCRQGRH